MHFFHANSPIRIPTLLLMILLLAGCVAGRGAFNKGETALAEEKYDQAVTSFLTAVQKDPESRPYRMKLQFARERAALQHKSRGDKLLSQQNYLGALQEYQLAADLDGSFYAANEGVELAGRYLQAQKLTAEAEELLNNRKRLQAKDAVEKALQQVADYQPALLLLEKIKQTPATVIDGVELEVTSTQPITLNFNDVRLPDVFDILTKLSGINFILDEDVRSNKTTLFLEKATFAQALELLLRMNKLDKKILNSKTIILFPKSRDKQKQFEDQLVQTFYLSNLDAKKAVNLLRTMLQVRKIYVNEELNAVIMRDSPDVVRLAQKILEANDRSNAEVILDLELIEVNFSDTQELGLKLSNYDISAGLAIPGTGQIARGGEIKPGDSIDGLVGRFTGLPNLDPYFSIIPAATFRLMKTQVNADVLANPKIRVKNKEKAKVHIGSREPVITATTNNGVTTDSVTYVDVGVKLDVEPNIQLDNTIVTKIGLEVSNVAGSEETTNGTKVLTISTTNANTSLTLKDGEQTVIGGLIRDDKKTTKYKVPLLGDIPLIGELFNGTDKNNSKREILLSITPHIVKSVTLPEPDAVSIWSGGEDDLKFGRNFGSFVDEYQAGQEGLMPEVKEQPAGSSPQQAPIENRPVPPEMQPEAKPEKPSAQMVQPLRAVPQGTADVMIEENPVPAGTAGEGGQQETAQGVASVPGGEIPPGVESDATGQTMGTQSKDQVPQELIASNQPADITAKPKVFIQGPMLVKVGENFTVSFVVSEIENLFSAPMYVQYDPNLLELFDVAEGGFLSRDGDSTVFTQSALGETGRLIIGMKQGSNGKGVSGTGDLFSLQFKALAAGTSSITAARMNFRNPQGERLPVDPVNLSIEIKE